VRVAASICGVSEPLPLYKTTGAALAIDMQSKRKDKNWHLFKNINIKFRNIFEDNYIVFYDCNFARRGWGQCVPCPETSFYIALN